MKWDQVGHVGHGISTAMGSYIFLGLMLVTGSYDSTIVVWDVENEMQKVKLQVKL